MQQELKPLNSFTLSGGLLNAFPASRAHGMPAG
jgi:hypothetical protein